jgi:3-hydroxybutyryl-CoA dehydrogenase
MARDFSTVGVIGLGTMGAGIVEVFARNGIDVVAVEVDDAAVEHGRSILQHSTDRAVSRGKLTVEDQAALLSRVTFTSDMGDLRDCQLVVEAVPEHLDLKKEIFAKVDGIVAPDAVLATNTSSLPVTEIAVATSNPKRVVGMHFFNPAPVLQFVEVVRTVITEDEVFEDVKALAQRLGKQPVVVGDKAGFIANALLFGYLNHAVSMFESKYASREDIDAAMRLGCGYPMGPLALMDLIGLDTAYEILDTMYKQGRDRLHAPRPILKQMVTAGMLGRKTGRGFYTYEAPDSPVVVPDALTPSADDKPQLRHEIAKVGVVGTGTMAAGSSRCSPRPASTSSTPAAAKARSTASAPPSRGRSTRPSSAASSRSPRRTTCSADSPVRPGSTTWPTSTSSSRRSPRTSRSRRRCSRTSTRSASPARSWRRRPPPCR